MTNPVKTTFNLGDVLLISDDNVFTSFVGVVSQIVISRNGVSYGISAGIDEEIWCALDFENQTISKYPTYRIIRKVGEAEEFGMKINNVL